MSALRKLFRLSLMTLRFKRFNGAIGRACVYFWAGPATLLGLLLNALAGRDVQRRWQEGVLEVSSPRIARWLGLGWYGGGSFAAITLGHVVLGRCEATLARCRAHERVHVRQYELWGVFLLPAYLIASGIAQVRGGDAYLDNMFEVQARAAEINVHGRLSTPPET
jgi:hypothetical protein